MSTENHDVPGNWDAIIHREPGADRPASGRGPQGRPPPLLNAMASAWADLAVLLAVCAGALIAVLLMGERPTLAAFWWAISLAVAWWGFAAAVLLVVRHGTPGMLLAGIRFDAAVPRSRLPWVIGAALVGIATLGLSAAVGGYAAIRVAADRGLLWEDPEP